MVTLQKLIYKSECKQIDRAGNWRKGIHRSDGKRVRVDSLGISTGKTAYPKTTLQDIKQRFARLKDGPEIPFVMPRVGEVWLAPELRVEAAMKEMGVQKAQPEKSIVKVEPRIWRH